MISTGTTRFRTITTNARKRWAHEERAEWNRQLCFSRTTPCGLWQYHSELEFFCLLALQRSMPERRNSSIGMEAGCGEESPARFNRWNTCESESSTVRSMGSRGGADLVTACATRRRACTDHRSSMDDVRRRIRASYRPDLLVLAAFVLLDYLRYNLVHCLGGEIGIHVRFRCVCRKAWRLS
jgi:hypothetical protein